MSTDRKIRDHAAPKSEAKSQPHTYVHNRGTSLHRRKRFSRSESAGERLKTKKVLRDRLTELGELELADKMERCHSRFSVLTCGSHIISRIPNFTCEFRLCPDCARRRSRKIVRKHLPIAQEFLLRNRVQPVHLVLTQEHRPETRKEATKRLFDAFNKLQRRVFWKDHFKGAIWSLEFTKGRDGLPHAHLHLTAFRSRFFDIELLRGEWKAITGGSHVLRLDPIFDLEKGLLEVVKYISKPLDTKRLSAADLAEFLEMKGMKFFGTVGEFRKFCHNFEPSVDAGDDESEFSDLVQGSACPHCSEPLFDLRMSAAELIQFYALLDSSPQQLNRRE